ncbi:hypothetical protein LSP04_12100 [Levilactobacillus spicheri]|uniref:LPXTG cell wall anchor domain-containing protein n=1 Tax=Levilactobacillus spicheri TaxID=216463 RepID=A0ABQ0WP53_9LACO|nr:hypothetical protein LSP04_12100 [Levilactobacillus spicheri]
MCNGWIFLGMPWMGFAGLLGLVLIALGIGGAYWLGRQRH